MSADERLSELFGRAIALGDAERAALLAQLRTDDAALADNLAALLQVGAARLDAGAETALAHAGTAVDALAGTAAVGLAATAVDAGAATAADVTRPSDAPVQVRPPRAQRRRPDIPGFRLLDVLGEGAMGTVYAGEQDAPRRPVAIKVLHAHSPSAFARFLSEAEIMARLDHPGIAKVLEAGQSDGHPYFVMERVDGVTLDVHVRGEALPLAARLRLVVALCDAIHHAHVKGVIHRDLKPSNVMVRPDGRVAVLDFGIARLATVDGSSSGETRAGELIGTPVYMSPEQARLRPDEVDARSDVYTLGVILYELCAGELPYDVRGKALPDVARAICHDPPRALGRRGPGLRGDLEAIADKALAKEPPRRYQSAAALADDVRAHLDGATVSARVPGAIEQLRRMARRRPGLALAVIAAIVGGSLFATAVTYLWLEARDARRVAERERARLAVTNDKLERRTNQLVLDQARAALGRDPTSALASLATLTERGVVPDDAWKIADEAMGRAVARAVLRGHTDEVRWAEALPGTDRVLTAGYDGLVLRWDAGASAPRELWRTRGRAHAVRPSPDGALIAIGADAGVLRVIDVDGGVVAEPAGLSGDVGLLAWSADGAWLVAGDADGVVWLWPRAGGGPGRRLDGPTSEIEALEFDRSGAAVVAGEDAGAVWRWSLDDGRALSARVGGEAVAVWTDRDGLAALDSRGEVRRWYVDDGALVDDGVVATGMATKTGAFAADGTCVLGAADGRVARIVDDKKTMRPVAALELYAHPVQVRAIAIGPGGRIVTGADDGSLRVWDRGRALELRGHRQRLRHVAFARGGDEVLASDSGGEVRRWAISRVEATVLVGHTAPVARLANAGDTLASADVTGELRRWRLSDGSLERIGSHGARVTGLVFARDALGPVMVSGGADGTVAWDGTLAPRGKAGSPVTALATDARGTIVAAATEAGPIALFPGDGGERDRVLSGVFYDGTPVRVLGGHAGGTDAIAYSPDGTLLASGGQDRVVRVWSIAAPDRPPVELGPLPDDTRHILFTAEGAALVAAGDDGKVRAWTVRDGAVAPATMRVLADHRTAILALAIDASGAIVSEGRDHRRLITSLDGSTPPDHVVPDAAPWIVVPDARYAVGRDDGAILIRPSAPRSLADLHRHIAALRSP